MMICWQTYYVTAGRHNVNLLLLHHFQEYMKADCEAPRLDYSSFHLRKGSAPFSSSFCTAVIETACSSRQLAVHTAICRGGEPSQVSCTLAPALSRVSTHSKWPAKTVHALAKS